PAVVAALCLVAWWSRRAGGRPLRRGALTAELIALAGLVVAAVARPSLDLPWSPEVLYCGLALLLLHHLALQLLPLRPLLGAVVPPRPSASFFCLPLIAYLAFLPWSTAHRPPDGDEPYYL